MDILDYFQADLDALRSMIFELRVADENSREEADAFTALVSLVKWQTEAQESLLLPVAASHKKLKEVIHHSFERIAAAREIEAIIECCTNRATWRASVNVYCEIMDTRIMQESRELLPALYDHLSEREREKLGLEYKKLRGFEKGHPGQKNWKKIWAAIINQAG